MKEGGISGMNGIMVGMTKLHGMEGVALLGETSATSSTRQPPTLCSTLGHWASRST